MASRGTSTGLERWACVNLVKFNRTKCKVMHLDQRKPKEKVRELGEQKALGRTNSSS